MPSFLPLTSPLASPRVSECKHLEWSELREGHLCLAPGCRGHLQEHGVLLLLKIPSPGACIQARDPG